MKKEHAQKFDELSRFGTFVTGILEYKDEKTAKCVIREMRRVLGDIGEHRFGCQIWIRPITQAQIKYLAEITGGKADCIWKTFNDITPWNR